MPAIGKEASSSGITGVAQAACSMCARLSALARALRLSPEPLSMSGMAVLLPTRDAHHWRSAARALSAVAGTGAAPMPAAFAAA